MPTKFIEPFDVTPTQRAKLADLEGFVIPFHDSRGPNGFRAPNDARVPLVHEMPWHRTLAHLLLTGKSGKSCAEMFQKSLQEISTVRNQPWFKALLELLAAQQGITILDRLADEANNCLETMIELRDNPNSPANVRLNAAENLLSRVVAKKTETTVRRAEVQDPDAEAMRLREQISLLQNQTSQS